MKSCVSSEQPQQHEPGVEKREAANDTYDEIGERGQHLVSLQHRMQFHHHGRQGCEAAAKTNCK